MARDLSREIAGEPLYGVGTYLVPVTIGAGYFVFLAWLVSLHTRNPWANQCATLIHGGLLSAVMTWLWLPPKGETSMTCRQFTLAGILGITAVILICISYVAQIVRGQAAVNDSPLAVILPVVFFSLLYFVFSLPFATFLGVGLFRIGQVVMRRHA